MATANVDTVLDISVTCDSAYQNCTFFPVDLQAQITLKLVAAAFFEPDGMCFLFSLKRVR
jgi:hypothetical protein